MESHNSEYNMAKGAVVLAAGFNAHGQLDPTSKVTNIHSFREISHAEKYDPDVEWKKHAVPAALWSSTLLYKDNKLIHRGESGGYPQNEANLHLDPSVVTFFGDISGIKGFCSQAGDLFRFMPHPSKQDSPFRREPINTEDLPSPRTIKVTRAAIAGNGKVCVAVHAYDDPDDGESEDFSDDDDNFEPTMINRQLCDPTPPSSRPQPIEDDIYTYPELNCLFTGCCVQTIHTFKKDQTYPGVADLVATSTTFTVLTGDHRVVTMGDPRYPDLLGRTPSSTCDAAAFGVVSALDGIPVRKIVAGSWMVAAVSEENDLYIWGHCLPIPPTRKDYARLSTLLHAVNEEGQREEVHLVDVDGGADVADVAVGDEHVVVLTTEGAVWGFGSNEYGQLGLGEMVKGTE
ncbi:MAG: hypothetical protein Q9206_006875, partial [Seirophora lacunosa]